MARNGTSSGFAGVMGWQVIRVRRLLDDVSEQAPYAWGEMEQQGIQQAGYSVDAISSSGLDGQVDVRRVNECECSLLGLVIVCGNEQ